MLFRKATLIQDIQGYLDILKPLIARFIEPYLHLGLDEETIFQWIVEEEIERIYHLFTQNHEQRLMPHSMIYNWVQSEVGKTRNMELNRITTYFIKAPRLYSDNNIIDIKVDGRDLHIGFYRDSRINPF